MDKNYRVGGHLFTVAGKALVSAAECMAGLRPFASGAEDAASAEGMRFCQCEESSMPFLGKALYSFRYEEVESVFGTASFDTDSSAGLSEGYLLELRPAGEEKLRLWIKPAEKKGYLSGNHSPRLVRFALWTGYGVMTAHENTVALHGSCIVYRQKAVLFLGESGTGKSTHTRLWREHIAGSKLLNDDSPVVRCEDDGVWIYGSPWSGKTPCYKAERYPLAGCVRLSQAPYNKISKPSTLQAFAALHPSAPPAFAYDGWLYDGICTTLGKILSSVPVYRLACLPDKAAAELACDTLYNNRQQRIR